jgi:hypothetical protein
MAGWIAKTTEQWEKCSPAGPQKEAMIRGVSFYQGNILSSLAEL